MVDTSVVDATDEEGSSEKPSLVRSVGVLVSTGVDVEPSVVLGIVLVSEKLN